MFGDAGIVGVDVGCAKVCAGTAYRVHAVAERWNTKTDADAQALFIDFVRVGVLQAFDIKIAADIGDHLLATRHRAFDLGIELKAGKV